MQFTYWHEVEDTFLLGQVFSEPISIGSIDLFSVEMLRDGPTVRFYFDLVDRLPNRPLPHWGEPNVDYNRCRMGVDCFGVSQLSILGLSTQMSMKLTISKTDTIYHLSLVSEDTSIDLRCLNITLIAPTVYKE